MRPFSILFCALCVAFEIPCPTWAARDEDEEEEVIIDGVTVKRKKTQVHANASSMALPIQAQQDSSLMEQGFKINLTAEDTGTATLEIAYRSLAEDCEVDPAKFTADVEGVQKLEKCVATLEDFSKKAKKRKAESQQLNNKYSKAFIETWGLLKQILDAHRKVKDLHMSAVMDQREAGANLARQLQGIRTELKTIVGPEMEFADLDETPAAAEAKTSHKVEEKESGVEENVEVGSKDTDGEKTQDESTGDKEADPEADKTQDESTDDKEAAPDGEKTQDESTDDKEAAPDGEKTQDEEKTGENEGGALLAMNAHRHRTQAITVGGSSKMRSRAHKHRQKRRDARHLWY